MDAVLLPRMSRFDGLEDRPATTPWENAADMLHSDDARIETWRSAGFTTALVTIPPADTSLEQAAIVDLGAAYDMESRGKNPRRPSN